MMEWEQSFFKGRGEERNDGSLSDFQELLMMWGGRAWEQLEEAESALSGLASPGGRGVAV